MCCTHLSYVQVVVMSLVKAVPGIVNVMVLISIFWLIFAILGVSLFKGKLYSCSDSAVDALVDCVGNFTSPIDNSIVEREWVNNPSFNFDSAF